jgi:hypothetical protein
MSTFSLTVQNFVIGAEDKQMNVVDGFQEVKRRYKKDSKSGTNLSISRQPHKEVQAMQSQVRKPTVYISPEDRVYNAACEFLFTEITFAVKFRDYSLLQPGTLLNFKGAKFFSGRADFVPKNLYEERWVKYASKWEILVNHLSTVNEAKCVLAKTSIPVEDGKWSQVFFIVLESRARQTASATKQIEINGYVSLLEPNLVKVSTLLGKIEKKKKLLECFNTDPTRAEYCNKLRTELGKLNSEFFLLNKLVSQQTRTIVDLIYNHAVEMLEKVKSFTDDWKGAIKMCETLSKERVKILNSVEKTVASTVFATATKQYECTSDDEESYEAGSQICYSDKEDSNENA